MPSNESLNLSLIENSHAFLNEAVSKALLATSDSRQWQFAIVNLVQCVELSLKAALSSIHPVLIYENIDNPRNTVGPLWALDRLANKKIADMVFSETDRAKLKTAIDIRNQVTHSEFALTAQYAAAKFFEIFAFVSDFQRRHLSTKVSDVIAATNFEELLHIRNLLEELVQRALERIREENIDADFVWECRNCGADTFVIEDAADTCYTCSHTESVVECPQLACHNLMYEGELQSFVDDIETDYSEGVTTVINSYGYTDYHACSECLAKIRQDIHEQRERDEIDYLEREYYYSKMRRLAVIASS